MGNGEQLKLVRSDFYKTHIKNLVSIFHPGSFSSWVPESPVQHLENLPLFAVYSGCAGQAAIHLSYWIRPELSTEAVADYFGRTQ